MRNIGIDTDYDAFQEYLQYPGFKYGEVGNGNVLEKALPKPKNEPKPKTEPGVKAARKQMGVGGKVRYTYPNDKGGTKPKSGPGEARVAKPAAPPQDAPPVSSTEAKADPEKFCAQIGIKPETLQKIVSKFDGNLGGCEGFVKFMLTNTKELSEKYQLNGEFYRILYDEVSKQGQPVQKSLVDMSLVGYYKHVAYKRRDPRTGKMITVKGGKVSTAPIAVNTEHTANDDHMKAIHKYLKKKGGVFGEDKLVQHVHDYVRFNYNGSDSALTKLKNNMLESLFESGAVHLKEKKQMPALEIVLKDASIKYGVDLLVGAQNKEYHGGVGYYIKGKNFVALLKPGYLDKIAATENPVAQEALQAYLRRVAYTAKVVEAFSRNGYDEDAALSHVNEKLYNLGGDFLKGEITFNNLAKNGVVLPSLAKRLNFYIRHITNVCKGTPKAPKPKPLISDEPKVSLADVGGIKHDDHKMLKEWAIASNVSRAALRFRIGAAALMGVKNVVGAVNRVRNSVVNNKPKSVYEPYLKMLKDEVKPKNVKASMDMVKRISKATQKAYGSEKTVRLYRGVSGEQASSILKSMGLDPEMLKKKNTYADLVKDEKILRSLHGKDCEVACDTCSSFTDDYGTATGFSSGFFGLVLSVDVPVKSLIASYKAFPGSLSMPSNFLLSGKWGKDAKEAYSTEFEVLLGVNGTLKAKIFHPTKEERAKLNVLTKNKKQEWEHKSHVVEGLPRDLSHIYGNNTEAGW